LQGKLFSQKPLPLRVTSNLEMKYFFGAASIVINKPSALSDLAIACTDTYRLQISTFTSSTHICMADEIILNNGGKEQILEHDICVNSIMKMADALDVLSGKWKIPIIISLSFGPKRFNEISKDLKKITDKSLSKELKFLEENLLITKNTISEEPPVFEYKITEHGLSINNVLGNLKQWGKAHREKIFEEIKQSKSLNKPANDNGNTEAI
jgi:DNA-binding HxlR family transcriptional regulator